MSQAHKNRTSPRKFDFPLAGSKGFGYEQTVNKKSFYRKRAQRMADFEARQAEKSPKANPSGSAKYKGITTPSLGSEPWAKAEPLPDKRHEGRISASRERKNRGTQSSATRVPVK